jgi:hypothetical protein
MEYDQLKQQVIQVMSRVEEKLEMNEITISSKQRKSLDTFKTLLGN